MSALYKVGSLSDHGWVSDPAMILNHVFTSYLLSDASQSILYQGAIINLPQTYYRFINDPTGMAAQVSSDLQDLLSKYFTSVEVECSAREITKKYFGVVMKASVVTENNERLELSKVTEISSNDVKKVIDVNNYGEGLALINNL